MSNMDDRKVLEDFYNILETYIRMVRTELAERWNNWPLNLANRRMQEVIGALMARQVTLATQLAGSPSIWNAHIAPIVLRTMADTYITFAWIFREPFERSQEYISYGLGQEKLYIEHLKAQLEADGEGEVDEHPLIRNREEWLNSQRFAFLTEVNVGSWSGVDTRKMAEDAECIDVHRFAYAPFSSTTHSMWNHVGKCNLDICRNPLHRHHGIPVDPSLPGEPDYMLTAAGFVRMTFDLFDEKTGTEADVDSAHDSLYEAVENFAESHLQNFRGVSDASAKDVAD